jgi:hypothetical protein
MSNTWVPDPNVPPNSSYPDGHPRTRKCEALRQALHDLYTECDAMQHEELDRDRIWGPIMRAARKALGEAK